MNLKDSETKINLMRAFAGESQARNRYDIAAEAAKKENLHIIEELFKYTANQEKAHAEVFYSKLKEVSGENIKISDAAYPVGVYDSTLKLLNDAVHNEHEEHSVIYKSFAETAKKEGFCDIEQIFTKIASIEKVHEERFTKCAIELQNNTLFKKDIEVKWICTNCGYIYEGKEAPKVCPVCQKPQDYYVLFNESFFE